MTTTLAALMAVLFVRPSSDGPASAADPPSMRPTAGEEGTPVTTPTTAPPTIRSRPRTEQARASREVLVFLLVAFALSWGVGLVTVAVLDLGDLGLGLGALCPGIAAFAVTRWRTGSFAPLWRDVARWRVAPRWYLAAVGLPVVLAATAALVVGATGGGSIPETASVGASLSFLPLAFLLFGGPEEPGWRGYLLPRVQIRFGALGAGILVGVVWTFWHTPLWLIPGSLYQDLDLAAYGTLLVGFSVLYTWLYNSTGGSVLIAMLFHAAMNVVFAWLPEGPLAFWVYAGLVWTVALALVAVHGPRTLSAGGRETR
jgi:uncharacterized protein